MFVLKVQGLIFIPRDKLTTFIGSNHLTWLRTFVSLPLLTAGIPIKCLFWVCSLHRKDKVKEGKLSMKSSKNHSSVQKYTLMSLRDSWQMEHSWEYDLLLCKCAPCYAYTLIFNIIISSSNGAVISMKTEVCCPLTLNGTTQKCLGSCIWAF